MGDNLLWFILKRTIYIKNIGFWCLRYFPNLKKVDKVSISATNETVKYLEDNKISGVLLVFSDPDQAEKFTSRVDSKIIIRDRISGYPGNTDKIYACGAHRIIQEKYYPNLEYITFRNDIFADKPKSNLFPKLRMATVSYVEKLDNLYKIFPNVRQIFLTNNIIDIEDDYYKYHCKIGLMNNLQLIKLLELGKKYGGGNISAVLRFNPDEVELVHDLFEKFKTKIKFVQTQKF